MGHSGVSPVRRPRRLSLGAAGLRPGLGGLRISAGDGARRYRGIATNGARAQRMSALANLVAVRHRLLPRQARCVV